MRYNNELKVGAALVISAVVLFFGVRFFLDIPLIRGTYDLFTTVEDAGGLIPGNPVKLRGIQVGTIEAVALDPATNNIDVRFRIDQDVRLPEGTTTEVVGFDALAVVQLELLLGPPANPPIAPGGFVPNAGGDDLLATLTDQAPKLVDQVDRLLGRLDTTVTAAGIQLGRPGSPFNQTLRSVDDAATSLDRLLEGERARLATTLESIRTLAASLEDFAGTQGDSVAVAVESLNATLTQLNRNLVALEASTTRLDAILAKIDEGEGTLGLLVNDPDLYLQLEAATVQLNAVLADFQQNPGRYLRELELVDVF